MKKKFTMMIFFLALAFQNQSFAEGECRYKTETILEDGVIKSVKEIKTCEETQRLKSNFFNLIIRPSREGNDLFWNMIAGYLTLKGSR